MDGRQSLETQETRKIFTIQHSYKLKKFTSNSSFLSFFGELLSFHRRQQNKKIKTQVFIASEITPKFSEKVLHQNTCDGCGSRCRTTCGKGSIVKSDYGLATRPCGTGGLRGH